MRSFLKMVFLLLILFPLNLVYAYTMDDLFNELDTPQWSEKVSDPAFIEKFKNPDMVSTVINFTDTGKYHWRYRLRAIKLLGSIGTPQAKKALLDRFQDYFFHRDCPALKSYLADALGNFKPEMRLIEVLKEGLKDPELLVREAAARSLGKLSMPESIKYLKEAFLSEKSMAVKIAIVNALKEIDTPEAKNFIIQIESETNNRELINALGGSI